MTLLVRCHSCGQNSYNPFTSQCGGRCCPSQQAPPSAAPPFGTAVLDADRGAGSEDSGMVAGLGEVTGHRPRKELSPHFLWLIPVGLVAAGYLDAV